MADQAPTIEQRLAALTSALEAQANARAEYETASQLRGKAIDARLNSQAMHIEILVNETHALGVKVDRIAESVDTLKLVATDLVKLATSHERRISTLEGIANQ